MFFVFLEQSAAESLGQEDIAGSAGSDIEGDLGFAVQVSGFRVVGRRV